MTIGEAEISSILIKSLFCPTEGDGLIPDGIDLGDGSGGNGAEVRILSNKGIMVCCSWLVG